MIHCVSVKNSNSSVVTIQNLNQAQLQAVNNTEGPLLILAGAGAGKTKTITERIVHIVHYNVFVSFDASCRGFQFYRVVRFDFATRCYWNKSEKYS